MDALRRVCRHLLPGKLAILCVERTGISPDKAASHITSPERKHLPTWLKDFRIRVAGHRETTSS